MDTKPSLYFCFKRTTSRKDGCLATIRWQKYMSSQTLRRQPGRSHTGAGSPGLSSTQSGPPQTHDNLSLSFSSAGFKVIHGASAKSKGELRILQDQSSYNMIL